MNSDVSVPIVYHRTMVVEDVEIFYRTAGEEHDKTVLLLHGFPSSSHMFRNLIPHLADKYYVIAPDYPGFGLSESPGRGEFQYSFDTYARLVNVLLGELKVDEFAMYIMDYGAPVGFRLALAGPDRVSALIVQNGNAYEEGLRGFWDPIRALWADNSEANRNALRPFMSLESTRSQYQTGVRDTSRLDPAAWLYDQQFLDRPGNIEIQLDLLYDYRNNVALYDQFQDWMKARQLPTLILWGQNDLIFPAEGALAYRTDLPFAQIHLLDTGHFALEDKADEMIPLMREFLSESLAEPAITGEPDYGA